MQRLTIAFACCARLALLPAAIVAQPRSVSCTTADSIAAGSVAKLDSIGRRAAETEHYSLGYCMLKRLDAIEPTRLGISYDLAIAAFETGHFAEATHFFARAEREAAGDSTHDRWSLAAWMDGYARVSFGDTAGARAIRARLLSVDPMAPGVTGIESYLAHFERRFADARRPMQDRVNRGMRLVTSYGHIGDAYLAAGMLDSARTAYEQALALDTTASLGVTGHAVTTLLAAIALAQGRRDDAARLLRRSEARVQRALADGRDSQVYPYDMAAISALRGDTAAALSWLDRAIDNGWRKSAFTRFDPLLVSLHDSPKFARIMARDDSLSSAERRRAERVVIRP
jgi:tetratricopeptide (TPR) repeat protein